MKPKKFEHFQNAMEHLENCQSLIAILQHSHQLRQNAEFERLMSEIWESSQKELNALKREILRLI